MAASIKLRNMTTARVYNRPFEWACFKAHLLSTIWAEFCIFGNHSSSSRQRCIKNRLTENSKKTNQNRFWGNRFRDLGVTGF